MSVPVPPAGPYVPRADGQPDQYVRRRPLAVRVLAAVLLVMGLLMAGIALVLVSQREASGAALCGALSLVLAVLGLWILRSRVVMDRDGVHARGLTGTRHLAWPSVRQAWTVVVTRNHRGLDAATAQVPGPDGSPVNLYALTVQAVTAEAAAARLDAEIDGIWAWALSRGFARATSPAAGPTVQAGYGTAPVGGAGGVVTAGYGLNPVGTVGAAGTGGLRRRVLRPADPALLSQPQLVFRGSQGVVRAVLLCVPGALMTAGGILLATHSHVQAGPDAGRRAQAIMGHGPVTVALGLVMVVLGLLTFYVMWDSLRARTVMDASGLHVRSGSGTAHLPWPMSRSDLAATLSRSSFSASLQGLLVTADGVVHRLRGVTRAGRGTSAELEMLSLLDSVWAWGVAHGVARESGRYTQATDAATETARRRTEDRFDYLAAGGR